MKASVRSGRLGFTLIQVVVSLVVVGILAAMAYIATGAAREAAAVTAMTKDLESFAILQTREFEVRQLYADPAEILAGPRLALSLGVEVDSSAISPEQDRVYLRVRHEDSQQRCSADLSPVSLNARNRIVCFGVTGRDSAEAPPIGDPPLPEVPDTVGPGSPPGSPATMILSPPGVEAPADVVAAPGQAITGTFAVTNHSGVARQYRFLAEASDAAIVADPQSPVQRVIAAGATVEVTIGTSVRESVPAGRTAALSLQVVDADDPAFQGRASYGVSVLPVLLDPALQAPSPIEVAPGTRGDLSWRACNRSNTARTYDLRVTVPATLDLQSVDGAGRLRFEPGLCRDVRSFFTLREPSTAGSEHLPVLTVSDVAAPVHGGRASGMVRTALVPADPVVRGPADTLLLAGAVMEVRWEIANRTNAARSFVLSMGTTGDLSQEAGPVRTIELGEGASAAVAGRVRLSDSSRDASRSQVSLRVEDARSAVHAATHQFAITTVRPNAPPVACFEYMPSLPRVGQLVRFDASCSADADGDAVSVRFEFGDGSAEPGNVVDHAFAGAGAFPVTAHAVDEHGLEGEPVTQYVNVRPPVARPTARMEYGPYPDPLAQEEIRFDGAGSVAGDTGVSIVRWTWDFGDLTEADGAVARKTYFADLDAPGYPVCLVVEQSDGQTDRACRDIPVRTTTHARFTAALVAERRDASIFGATYLSMAMTVDARHSLGSTPVDSAWMVARYRYNAFEEVESQQDFSNGVAGTGGTYCGISAPPGSEWAATEWYTWKPGSYPDRMCTHGRSPDHTDDRSAYTLTVTVFVLDARGRLTQQTATRSAWDGGPLGRPVVHEYLLPPSAELVFVEHGDGRRRYTVSSMSDPDGRARGITGWTVEQGVSSSSGDTEGQEPAVTELGASEMLEVDNPGVCGYTKVTVRVNDNLGHRGSGTARWVGPTGPSCSAAP